MCLVELALIIWGFFAIGSNRVSFFKYRVVHGRPATIIGWLLLVPIFPGLVVGCKHVYVLRKSGRIADFAALEELTLTVTVVELTATAFTLLLCFIIFVCCMEKPGGYRPPWEGDDYQRWGGGEDGGPARAPRINSEDFFRGQ